MEKPTEGPLFNSIQEFMNHENNKKASLESELESGQMVELKRPTETVTRFVFEEKNEKGETMARFHGKDSTEYSGQVKKVKQTG